MVKSLSRLPFFIASENSSSMSSISLTYAGYAASPSWAHQAVAQRIDASQNWHELTSPEVILREDIRYQYWTLSRLSRVRLLTSSTLHPSRIILRIRA